MPTRREEAARARSAAVRSLGDRPSQRRASEHATQIGRAPVRAQLRDIEVRAAAAAGDPLHFSGYASVTESPFEMWDMFGPYTEVVAAGAFGQTLAQPDLDVPLVLQHDPLRRIARTTNDSLQLAEDDQGLKVDADLDPADVDVAYIVPKLRSGLIDEMSFMFVITSGQWSPDYTEFRINSVDINRGDTSIVGYGANPATTGTLRAESIDQLLARADVGELNNLVTRAKLRLREIAPVPARMTKEQALSLP